MRLAPTKSCDLAAIGVDQLGKSIIQSQARHLCAAFNAARLHHVAPDASARYIPEDPLNEEWLHMGEGRMQGSKLIHNETLLQSPEPSGIDQWLWQMLIHLTIPIGQKIQGRLTSSSCAFGRHGFGLIPKFATDERQKRACGRRNAVQLRFDKAVTGVGFARL